MKHIVRSIAIGVLIGSALFFLPFRFPILLLIILFVIIRSRRRRFRRVAFGWGGPHFGYRGGIVPIDGFVGYRNSNEPEQKITIQ